MTHYRVHITDGDVEARLTVKATSKRKAILEAHNRYCGHYGCPLRETESWAKEITVEYECTYDEDEKWA